MSKAKFSKVDHLLVAKNIMQSEKGSGTVSAWDVNLEIILMVFFVDCNFLDVSIGHIVMIGQ